MSRHPFTDEDIEAALSMFGTSSAMSDEGFAEDILRAAWESAVARGAVRQCYGYSYHSIKNTPNWVADTLITKENYENDGDIDFACAIIKLPEDKP